MSATDSSGCSNPTRSNTGRIWLELAVGAELWATTQMEQELDSV
jgi:hypothetical protein